MVKSKSLPKAKEKKNFKIKRRKSPKKVKRKTSTDENGLQTILNKMMKMDCDKIMEDSNSNSQVRKSLTSSLAPTLCKLIAMEVVKAMT